MVRAWSPNGEDDIAHLMEALRDVQNGALLPVDPGASPPAARAPAWYLSIRLDDEEPLMRHWQFSEYFMECIKRAGVQTWEAVAAGTTLHIDTVRQIAEGRVIPRKATWWEIATFLHLNEQERRYGERLLVSD